MNERKRPTLYRIIDSDYASALAILVVIIFWLFFWLLTLMNLVDLQIPRYLVIGLTASGLGMLTWRWWLIRRIFTDGAEATGEITQIGFYRDRGKLGVTFTWQGQKVQKNTVIPKNDFTLALHKGQDIAWVIDRSQPSRAFLRDLYLRKPETAQPGREDR